MLVKKGWLKVTVLGVFLTALLMGVFMLAPAAHAKGTETKITLTGSAKYPAAKGTAKYKVDGSEREFQVELENAKSLAGKTVNVFAKGVKVGSFKVSSLGAGSLNLNTDKGQSVPFITAGSMVQIKTTTGVLIVSGKF